MKIERVAALLTVIAILLGGCSLGNSINKIFQNQGFWDEKLERILDAIQCQDADA